MKILGPNVVIKKPWAYNSMLLGFILRTLVVRFLHYSAEPSSPSALNPQNPLNHEASKPCAWKSCIALKS